MGPLVKRAARVGPEAARETTDDTLKHTASTPGAQCCGKRAAIAAYCNGWLSLRATAELFRTNPAWRSA